MIRRYICRSDCCNFNYYFTKWCVALKQWLSDNVWSVSVQQQHNFQRIDIDSESVSVQVESVQHVWVRKDWYLHGRCVCNFCGLWYLRSLSWDAAINRQQFQLCWRKRFPLLTICDSIWGLSQFINKVNC